MLLSNRPGFVKRTLTGSGQWEGPHLMNLHCRYRSVSYILFFTIVRSESYCDPYLAQSKCQNFMGPFRVLGPFLSLFYPTCSFSPLQTCSQLLLPFHTCGPHGLALHLFHARLIEVPFSSNALILFCFYIPMLKRILLVHGSLEYALYLFCHSLIFTTSGL